MTLLEPVSVKRQQARRLQRDSGPSIDLKRFYGVSQKAVTHQGSFGRVVEIAPSDSDVDVVVLYHQDELGKADGYPVMLDMTGTEHFHTGMVVGAPMYVPVSRYFVPDNNYQSSFWKAENVAEFLQLPEPAAVASFEVLDQLLQLDDGWDGEGSKAPNAETKRVAAEVFSSMAGYVSEAETEVDASTGEVTLTWFIGNDASVSVNVLPDGRVVVIAARLTQPSNRTVLGPKDLRRLERVAVDAGLHLLHG